METRLEKQMNFIIEIDKLKNVVRQNLILDKTRRENDAEHSWHFATIAMLLYEYADVSKVDLCRVLKMALVHDLVEIYAGDTFAYDAHSNQSKLQREMNAADKLFALLPQDQSEEIRALWEEFDAMDTPDAKYAAAIDRLQPFLLNYATQGEQPWRARGVTRQQVYDRIQYVRDAAPELWPLVLELLELSVQQGYLQA